MSELSRSVATVGWRRLQPHRILELFTFEPLFALFLFAGAFKSHPSLAWVPVDLTVLFMLLSGIVAIPALLRTKSEILPTNGRSIVIVYLVFLVWSGLSLLWSANQNQGVIKLFHMATLMSWSLFAGWAIVGADVCRIRRFMLSVAFVAAWMTSEILRLVFQGQNIHLVDWSRLYLGLGRLVGQGVVIVGGFLALKHSRFIFALGLFLLLGAYISVLLVGGGRGPLLASAAALLLLARISVRYVDRRLYLRRRWAILAGLSVIGIACIVLLLGSIYDLATLTRIEEALEPGGESSARTRIWLYSHAWNGWQVHPVAGWGLGGYSDVLRWGDVRVYPHNIVLEILVELGAVGLALFGLFLVPLVARADRALMNSHWTQAVVYMLFVNALLNAMVTGNLADNRVLFALSGILASAVRDV